MNILQWKYEVMHPRERSLPGDHAFFFELNFSAFLSERTWLAPANCATIATASARDPIARPHTATDRNLEEPAKPAPNGDASMKPAISPA